MSVVVGISRALRMGLAAGFAVGFNAELRAACEEFGVPPFSFNWGRDKERPQNSYDGSWTYEELLQFCEPDFPVVTWWMGPGRDENREKPRRFSGPVEARWRFFLAVRGKSNAGLVDMREAVEAALQATLVAIDVPEGRYRKDLAWGDPTERQWIDQDDKHVGWVQVVDFNASFEVNV